MHFTQDNMDSNVSRDDNASNDSWNIILLQYPRGYYLTKLCLVMQRIFSTFICRGVKKHYGQGERRTYFQPRWINYNPNLGNPLICGKAFRFSFCGYMHYLLSSSLKRKRLFNESIFCEGLLQFCEILVLMKIFIKVCLYIFRLFDCFNCVLHVRMIQASLNRGSRLGAKASVQGQP